MNRKQFILLIIGIVLATFAAALWASFNGPKEVDKGALFQKVEISSASQKVKTFVNTFAGKNGVYTYEDGTKEKYLLLNGFNVPRGEKAAYFSEVKMEVIDNALVISYNENFTDDYKNKEMSNLMLYRFKQPDNIDVLRVFKNGAETHFDSCYVER